MSCSSNEHYPAIVLAVHGVGCNETARHGGGHTYVDWSMMTSDGRPRSFRRRELRDKLVLLARGNHCVADDIRTAIRAAPLQLVNATQLPVGAWWPRLPPAPAFQPIGVNCSLFIRKIPSSTARTALQLFPRFYRTDNPQ